jgi:hypothetical protein
METRKIKAEGNIFFFTIMAGSVVNPDPDPGSDPKLDLNLTKIIQKSG